MKEGERLSSRLGFILLSAGCAIGCGNVWKFPWMAGQYGGGSFVLIYGACLALLGLPIMVMEFSLGRASRASPLGMYQKLEKPGHRWHIHGWFALLGNICLMSFYTTVAGWLIRYCLRFAAGREAGLSFAATISQPWPNVLGMSAAVFTGFLAVSFDLQAGVERVSKYMMTALLGLIIVLAGHSLTMEGAGEGLKFYLLPDLSKLSADVIAAAMTQAFFTLSLGIGSMAIFGSYMGSERTLLGEAVNVIALDSFVALTAGLIIFPACTTYGLEVGSGPALLFDTMGTVFRNMEGGRLWGTLFFLFMVFAAMTTVIAVFENISACVREKTGWSRPNTCLVCGAGMLLLSLTTALGYSAFSGFAPFGEGSAWLDLWDFAVSKILLPSGSLVFVFFCCTRYGWGWENFAAEANRGRGLKIRRWMRPVFTCLVPALILAVWITGLISFFG